MTLLYWLTFDSKLTFEKHLLLVSRAASQRLVILRKSWQVFHDRFLLERCFRGFVLPVLEYCSAVWCSSADTHLKLLDRGVSVARFLSLGVLECNIAHRQSVEVCVCCIRSGVARCTRLHTWTVCASAGYRRCSGRTSVYLCAASLQNLGVPPDLCSPLSVRLERSC